MGLVTYLKARKAEAGEKLPKLTPSTMSYWRKVEDGFYEEHPLRTVAVGIDMSSHGFDDVVEGDMVTIGQVVYTPVEFLERLKERGFLKMVALTKPVCVVRLGC